MAGRLAKRHPFRFGLAVRTRNAETFACCSLLGVACRLHQNAACTSGFHLNNDTKKSPLGVYKIKRDQSSQQPKFTIEFLIPKALRKALAPPQMGQIPNMRGRMMAMSQIPQLLKAEFIGSDGNLYQPNTTGAASGPIQRFSSSKSQSFSSPDGRSKGNSRTIRSGGSSQKADSRALEFGFNGLPAGVNIVEVRAIVSEPTKSTKSVDFQFKDVQLR